MSGASISETVSPPKRKRKEKPECFTRNTARLSRCSMRTVQMRLQIAEWLTPAVHDMIHEHAPRSTHRELMALCRLHPDDQMAVMERVRDHGERIKAAMIALETPSMRLQRHTNAMWLALAQISREYKAVIDEAGDDDPVPLRLAFAIRSLADEITALGRPA